MDRRWILAAGLAAVSVLAGVWFGRGVATPVAVAPSTEAVTTPSATTPALVYIHVSGWVADPGLVVVPAGSRVADAVAAAGGVRPGVDLDRVNLAQPLTDGQQVHIPGPGEEVKAPVVASGSAPDGLIRLNSAPASELERLPGVGPVLAGRIVAHRDAHGPFQSVEDLLDVAGIGEAKLAAIRDLVVVP